VRKNTNGRHFFEIIKISTVENSTLRSQSVQDIVTEIIWVKKTKGNTKNEKYVKRLHGNTPP
jgi:ribosomal protein L35AE/L33A